MSFQTRSDGYALAAGEGEALWFFNSLATVKAGGAQTAGALTMVELLCPPAFGPPPHLHEREDEAFYVLDGELTVQCGQERWTAGPGGFVFAPRQVVHTFTTGRDGVRMLQLTTPAQFEDYAREMGEPASARTLPTPQAPDLAQVLEVGARYGITFQLPPG